MYKRFGLLIAIFVLLCQSCTLLGDDSAVEDEQPRPVTSELILVEVSPPSGSGAFTAKVTYGWRMGDADFTISCTYPGEDGSTVTIAIPLDHKNSSYAFNFSITSPGEYAVNCQDSVESSASATFTVTSETPADQPVATTETKNFTHAKINFNLEKLVFTGIQPVGVTDGWLLGYCWPPEDFQNNGKSYFTVAEDGTLEGKCSVDTESDHILGELAGKFDIATGNVTFTLETSHFFDASPDGSSLSKVIYNGSSQIEGETASGTASFAVTCDAEGSVDCWDSKHVEYKGAVPFTILFYEDEK